MRGMPCGGNDQMLKVARSLITVQPDWAEPATPFLARIASSAAATVGNPIAGVRGFSGG